MPDTTELAARLAAAARDATRVVVEIDHVERTVGKIVVVGTERVEFSPDNIAALLTERAALLAEREALRGALTWAMGFVGLDFENAPAEDIRAFRLARAALRDEVPAGTSETPR